MSVIFVIRSSNGIKGGIFDILNNISELVTLVYMVNTFVYVNHAVSIAVSCIFDSNDEKVLILSR